MVRTTENETLRIAVKSYGAELTSVYDKKNGYEYLWQGDPAIWGGQSPILFPIVGRLIDDSYTLNGVSYTMPKHGFARKSEWTPLETTDGTLRFLLTDSDETRKLYPYSFRFTVTFAPEGASLTVTHEIENKNETDMLFSFGAHPGFNCKIGDTLEFSEAETLETEKIDPIRSLRLPETVPVLSGEKTIVITKDIFNEDALILHGMRSDTVTLHANGGKNDVRFSLNGAPYLGIWAKPGAPYVCIEPWWGVNDDGRKRADLSEKDGIRRLSPGEKFTYAWRADFSV